MYQRPYEKLVAWQEARSLFLTINELTKRFPQQEQFELASQMRRSAYSVPMNIAEGNAKRTPKSKRHFFEIALASLEELHCQTRLATDIGYIHPDEFRMLDSKINRVSYLLTRLRSSF